MIKNITNFILITATHCLVFSCFLKKLLLYDPVEEKKNLTRKWRSLYRILLKIFWLRNMQASQKSALTSSLVGLPLTAVGRREMLRIYQLQKLSSHLNTSVLHLHNIVAYISSQCLRCALMETVKWKVLQYRTDQQYPKVMENCKGAAARRCIPSWEEPSSLHSARLHYSVTCQMLQYAKGTEFDFCSLYMTEEIYIKCLKIHHSFDLKSYLN